jgi:hypothetical protein
VAATDENNKSTVSTNGIKTTTKQQQVSGRNENVDEVQNVDVKKKQTKTNATPPLNKQQSTGKSMLIIKLNHFIKSFILR